MTGTFLWLSFLTIGIGFSSCFSGGPPTTGINSVCDRLEPNSNSPHSQQTGNGNYFVSTDIPLNMTAGFYEYTPGQSYTG